jgi:transcriptional regulator with XRE-family HTH domain
VPRPPLTAEQRIWGAQLADALKAARQKRKIDVARLAVKSRISVDTIRSIESQRALSPGFFIVAALARELELDLDKLARRAMRT